MEKEKRESLVNDIENRLDSFFSDEEAQPPAASETAPMEKLKSLILSIDWEITESCLTDLIDETDVLLPRYEDNRYAHTLLRMLRAVGIYIRKRKAQAHPDAIKRIMSVFASLERLTGKDPLDEDVKKNIVAMEIATFKKLKEQVDVQRDVVAETHQVKAADTAATPANYVECRQFEQAMSEVEARLNSQVLDLKQQLAALQKKLDQLRG